MLKVRRSMLSPDAAAAGGGEQARDGGVVHHHERERNFREAREQLHAAPPAGTGCRVSGFGFADAALAAGTPKRAAQAASFRRASSSSSAPAPARRKNTTCAASTAAYSALDAASTRLDANSASSVYGTASRPSLCDRYCSHTRLTIGTSRRGSRAR